MPGLEDEDDGLGTDEELAAEADERAKELEPIDLNAALARAKRMLAEGWSPTDEDIEQGRKREIENERELREHFASTLSDKEERRKESARLRAVRANMFRSISKVFDETDRFTAKEAAEKTIYSEAKMSGYLMQEAAMRGTQIGVEEDGKYFIVNPFEVK